MRTGIFLAILTIAFTPLEARAGFDADVQGITYTGTAQVGSTIHLNVQVKNLSTTDSGYGGAATFCIVCNIDPPGWWNDFDQELTGQSFSYNETKTIAMPDFLLDDDGEWGVDCEARDVGCGSAYDDFTGNIQVAACADECSAGSDYCNGSTAVACVVGSEGCLVWEETLCDWEEKCDDGECVDKDCADFGLYLGSCGSATSDGDCKDGGQAVWECLDLGPVNCWAEVETCAGTSVCWDTTFGAATCIDDGHDDFCKAWKDAGSGCLHGESDCDSDGECLGSLDCVGPMWPYSGNDGCCNPGEEWDGEACTPGDCAGLGYPLGECGGTNDGDCKDNYNEIWTCVDAGPLNCWDLTDTCNGDTVCHDPLGSPAACIGPGHDAFCSAWKDAGSGCVYGESDCDYDSECLGDLDCVGPVFPYSGNDGCCNPGEGWDGEDCIPNDCGLLGYPLGECPMPSTLGACQAGYGEVWVCLDAGPVNCWDLSQDCGGGVCYVSSWDGAASCVYVGDDAYCSAMKTAGSGCDYGESDCDWDSECLGELECTGPFLVGPDGCCNPGDGWDGQECLPSDCAALGYPLGECSSASSDGDCVEGYTAIWECIDAGPINCWEAKESCGAGAICYDSWAGAATCLPPGHADYCHALEAAGSGCTYGQSDCDSDGECLGSLVCIGPIIIGQDGCCNEGDEWDGEVCSGQPPDEPVCPGGCLDIGEVSDSFEYPFVGNQSANGLWEKQVGAWYCTLDGGQVDSEDGDLVLGVTAGGVACGQVDSNTGDFYYGSYRASMKTSSVPGTCASLFFYGEDGVSEVDIEILSNEDGQHTVHFVVHPSGGLPCGSANHKCVDMAVAPSSGFHEYGFDILPGEAKFFIDGVEVASIDSFIPEAPGRMIINHWAGNPDWTGAPPAQAAELLVEWFEYTPAGLCNVCGQCGNDIVNGDEDCDGPALNGATCASLGYGAGDLICTGCAFNASGCDTEPSCGDGVCNSEEDCVTCPADCGMCPAACGDEVCSPGETCASCEEDCGACCPDGQCQNAYGEDCETCPADCGDCPAKCGNGVCDEDESCKDCGLDCGPCCGNGVCEPQYGEDCSFCEEDCGACGVGCGDGFCGEGESCASCPADCGNCCPDGICQAAFGEDCLTCSEDCGDCLDTCGDGTCQEDEDCVLCPSDCGACCGNGKCEPAFGEDCLYCPGDCGDCGGDCGDGVCGEDEHCASCGHDCGDCCGNAVCDTAWGEDCETCPGDCGDCANTCKDGICQPQESCQSCPSDCGACCGDGVCEPDIGEDSQYCPEDCADCVPSCLGKECGFDGCGGVCGICPEAWTCNDTGVCVPGGVPGEDTVGGVDTTPWDPNWQVESDSGAKTGGCAATPTGSTSTGLVLALMVLGLAVLRRCVRG